MALTGNLSARADGAGGVQISFDPYTVRDVLRMLQTTDDQVNRRLRAESEQIGEYLKRRLTAAAQSPSAPPVARRVAKSVKTKSDRYVVVKIGGKMKVGKPWTSRRRDAKGRMRKRKMTANAGQLLWLSEYGTASYHHSRTWRSGRVHNPDGYWINPTVEKEAPRIYRRWLEAVDRACRRAGWVVD